AASCPAHQRSALSTSISSFVSSAQYLYGYVEEVPGRLTASQQYLTNTLLGTKDAIVLVFYGFIVFFVAVYGLVYAWRSKSTLTATIVGTTLVVTALSMIVGLGFTFVIVYGDFCVDPASNLVASIPNEQLRNLTAFYANCGGYDPLGTALNATRAQVTATQLLLHNYSSSAPITTQSCLSTLQLETGFVAAGSIVITEFLTVVFLYCALVCSAFFYDLFDIDTDMGKMPLQHKQRRNLSLNITLGQLTKGLGLTGVPRAEASAVRAPSSRNLVNRMSQLASFADEGDSEEADEEEAEEGEEEEGQVPYPLHTASMLN
ncbi:unnamed protein product, partial [Sphagnum jensenii]